MISATETLGGRIVIEIENRQDLEKLKGVKMRRVGSKKYIVDRPWLYATNAIIAAALRDGEKQLRLEI